MKIKNKLTCKTGLNPFNKLKAKKNIIGKEVFDREIALCKMLFKEHEGKCGWGKCKNCGVVPLLYKLHKGKLLERSAEISKVRKKIFKL